MGLDLIIMPLDDPGDLELKELIIDNLLKFDPDTDIFGQIIELKDSRPILKPKVIPPQLKIAIFNRKKLNFTRKDSFGEELTFVYAKDLKKLQPGYVPSAQNRAIKAFINALPGKVPVILWWL